MEQEERALLGCSEQTRGSQEMLQRTDQIYKTHNLPQRFIHPKSFRGYREIEEALPHPFFRSTSMDYGWSGPSIHTVPTVYYPRVANFTKIMAKGGMYKNCSLNTEMDKPTYIPLLP